VSRSVLVRSVATAFVALASLSLLSACNGGDNAPTTVPTPGPTSVYRLDRDHDGIPDDVDQCPDQAEDYRWSQEKDGCPDTIVDLMNLGVSDIGDFWQRTFDGIGRRYLPPSDVFAYTAAIKYGCGLTVMNNASYCSVDRTISYDSNFLASFLENEGDFAVVFILAHEWGHLVQDLLGTQRNQANIDKELQADCLAGVWTADADSRQLLNKGATNEAIISLLRLGDPLDMPAFNPTAHGTPGLRIDAFDRGVQQGMNACFQPLR
jgi:predicted metalloprotease